MYKRLQYELEILAFQKLSVVFFWLLVPLDAFAFNPRYLPMLLDI